MASVPTGKAEVASMIPEMWSELFYDELRANLFFGNFFMRDYEGEIATKGDTVKVNQINKATGEIIEFGVGDTLNINSEALVVTPFEVKADRLATASFQIESLAMLQSIEFQQEARQALNYAVAAQVEAYVQSLLIPVAGNIINPAVAGDLGTGDVADLRRLLSKALVPVPGRALFLDVDYHSDIIQKTGFASSDFVPAGSPTANGEFSSPIYGFTIQEHNNLAADLGFACHPSALAFVMQKDLEFKLSDMHAAEKRGWLMTVDVLFGAKLFDNTRIAQVKAP